MKSLFNPVPEFNCEKCGKVWRWLTYGDWQVCSFDCYWIKFMEEREKYKKFKKIRTNVKHWSP